MRTHVLYGPLLCCTSDTDFYHPAITISARCCTNRFSSSIFPSENPKGLRYIPGFVLVGRRVTVILDQVCFWSVGVRVVMFVVGLRRIPTRFGFLVWLNVIVLLSLVCVRSFDWRVPASGCCGRIGSVVCSFLPWCAFDDAVHV